MTDLAPKKPARKDCPVCGVAMIASKSDATRGEFDTYSCLRCKTVITSAPVAPRP
jgi:hypothetical protein